MKTSELTGALLDYWVARAEGIEHPPYLREMSPGCCLVQVTEPDDGGTTTRWVAYQPSLDWAVGGPIMEEISRLRIHRNGDEFAAQTFADGAGAFPIYGYGETILIAAMRCYVANKFGSEVEDLP